MRINLDEIEQAAHLLGCAAGIAQTDSIVLFAAMVPNRDLKWRALEQLPPTGSGKIDYRALEQLTWCWRSAGDP